MKSRKSSFIYATFTVYMFHPNIFYYKVIFSMTEREREFGEEIDFKIKINANH